MSQLKNKIVWITGASSGIGEALAIACSKEGAKLILSSRRENELKRVADQCKTECLLLPLDLEKQKDLFYHKKLFLSFF